MSPPPRVSPRLLPNDCQQSFTDGQPLLEQCCLHEINCNHPGFCLERVPLHLGQSASPFFGVLGKFETAGLLIFWRAEDRHRSSARPNPIDSVDGEVACLYARANKIEGFSRKSFPSDNVLNRLRHPRSFHHERQIGTVAHAAVSARYSHRVCPRQGSRWSRSASIAAAASTAGCPQQHKE